MSEMHATPNKDFVKSLMKALLGFDDDEFAIKELVVLDTGTPLTREEKVHDFVDACFFFFADKFDLDSDQFALAIAALQDDYSHICNRVPVSQTVFDFVNQGKNIEGPLADTIDGMMSDDYKERFVAEYRQTKIRYDKLHSMVVKYEAGTLDFEPKCSLELLKEQKSHMGNYLRCLETRAEIEGIDLKGGE